MDKQTAIDLLDNLLGMVEDNHESDYDTAIKMGIDALKEKAQLSEEDATKDATFDYIDRQAAIDEFYGVKVNEENCTEYDIGYNDGIDFAVSKLSVLPSVQIVHCKDCRHYTTASNGCNGMCDIQLTMVMYPWDYCSYGEKRDG